MLALWRWVHLRITAMLPTLSSKQWKQFGVNTKVSIFLLTSMLFATNACRFIETAVNDLFYNCYICY